MFLPFTYDQCAHDAATGDVIAVAAIGSDACWPGLLWFAPQRRACRPRD